jgi:hypothetical protein
MEPTNTSLVPAGQGGLAGLAGLRWLACEKEGARRGRREHFATPARHAAAMEFCDFGKERAQATRRGQQHARVAEMNARERGVEQREVRVCVCVWVWQPARGSATREVLLCWSRGLLLGPPERRTTHPWAPAWKVATKSVVVLARSIPQPFLGPPHRRPSS